MTWDGDCAQLILLLDRRLVEQRAAALSGRPAGAIEFEPAIDLSHACGRELQSQLTSLIDLAERLGPQRRLSAGRGGRLARDAARRSSPLPAPQPERMR